MAAPRTVYWDQESSFLARGWAFMGRVCHAELRLYSGVRLS
jgi:hypothetical protein